MSAVRRETEAERTWEALKDLLGERLAGVLVEKLDRAQLPGREWLRRRAARARFEARQFPPNLSRRRQAMILDVDESTVRSWQGKKVRGNRLAGPQRIGILSKSRLKVPPRSPRQAAEPTMEKAS